MLPHFSSRAVEQHGAVLVTVALFMPVALLFFAYVVDSGYSWLHQRHLQVQADAAALAAAEDFQPCSDANITADAQRYGGVGTGAYNQQIPQTTASNIHELINSQTFYGQSSPVDTTVSTANPCSALMVDVKMTETNLPWWIGGFKGTPFSVPYINAQARVEVRQETSTSGSLPVAVNDLNPRSAEAYFIDETNGNQLGSVALAPIGASGGQAVWANSGTTPSSQPFPLTINKSQIGVRIAISGKNNLSGVMSTDCAASLVICYDATSSSTGVIHIQGYTATTGTVANPTVGQVTLASGGGTPCSDGYFTDPATNCTIAVNANVNFGTTTPPSKAEVDAVVGGVCYALTYQSTSGTTELWSSAASVPATNCTGFKTAQKAGTGYVSLTAGAGSIPISLQVNDSTLAAPQTFTNVQKSYTGDIAGGTTRSGPIQGAFISEVGGLPQDADSFPSCGTCTHNLVVTIDIAGTLQDAQSVSDPVYTLRFDGTGSQNQSVSCTPANGGTTFADELASGCAGTWTINPTLTCPDTSTDCLTPATGNKTNQVGSGMNQRILGSTKPSACTSPNHWQSFTFTNGVPSVSPTDPRLITLFVTPYGSFGGSGSSTQYPIADFATFYVTGWQGSGSGFNNPCQGNGDDTAATGTVVGHFIKYINTLGTGTGGTACVANSLDQCIAVMTR
jgi:hypothetical protein